MKTQVLGPNEGQQRQIKILNRIVTWHDSKGLNYEADPRHVEIVLEQLKMEDAKAVTTPGTREEGRTTEANKNIEQSCHLGRPQGLELRGRSPARRDSHRAVEAK